MQSGSWGREESMYASIVVGNHARAEVKETKCVAAQRGNKLIEFHGSKLVAGAAMGPGRPV